MKYPCYIFKNRGEIKDNARLMNFLADFLQKKMNHCLGVELSSRACLLITQMLSSLFDKCCELGAISVDAKKYCEAYTVILFERLLEIDRPESPILMRNYLFCTFLLVLKIEEEPEIKDLNALFADRLKLEQNKFNQIEIAILKKLDWKIYVPKEEIEQVIHTFNTLALIHDKPILSASTVKK